MTTSRTASHASQTKPELSLNAYFPTDEAMCGLPAFVEALIEPGHHDPDNLLGELRTIREDEELSSKLRAALTDSTLEMVLYLDADETERFTEAVIRGRTTLLPKRFQAIVKEFAELTAEMGIETRFEFIGHDPIAAEAGSL